MSTIQEKASKLKFQPVDTILMVNRDYGLMRVFKDKSATPYPRHSTGVDAEVLRQRLSYQQRTTGSSHVLSAEQLEEQLQRNSYSPPAVHIAISKSRTTPESLLRGTPHPKKGKAVDPKLLIKTLNKPSVTIIADPQKDPRSQKRKSIDSSAISSARSSMTHHPAAVGTPHPKKQVVLNPKNLLRQLTLAKSDEAVHGLGHGRKKKKVVVISPVPSIIASPSSYQETEHSDQRSFDNDRSKRESCLSFEERRKLFHMGEYTIAKNGKKLCDWPLSTEMKPIEVRDSLTAEAQKANEAIEKFIRKQGIFKTPHNTLAIARMSHRRTSDESVASRFSVKRVSANPSMSSRSSSKPASKKTSFFYKKRSRTSAE